jgi:hypothetical protein
MESDQLYNILAEIHKQLVFIAGSLNDLARVARAERPEAFKKPAQVHPPAPAGRF